MMAQLETRPFAETCQEPVRTGILRAGMGGEREKVRRGLWPPHRRSQIGQPAGADRAGPLGGGPRQRRRYRADQQDEHDEHHHMKEPGAGFAENVWISEAGRTISADDGQKSQSEDNRKDESRQAANRARAMD